MKLCAVLMNFMILAFAAISYATTPHPTLRFPITVALETFNPTEAQDFVTVRVLMNLGMGLTTLDDKLTAVPGLATWKILDRGKKIIFTLKKSAKWSDGTSVTAQDFIRGFNHTLSPQTIAKIAAPLFPLIKNAEDFKKGKTKSFAEVGIRAIDEKTVELLLNYPAPYIFQLLALPFSFPQKTAGPITINAPVSGPFILSAVKSDSKITLEPNPHFETPPQMRVELRVVHESATAVNLYETGQLDAVESLSTSEYLRLKERADMISAPFLATYYLGFRLTDSLFKDRRVREAISRAIDRDELTGLLQAPQKPSSSFVPAPLIGSDKSYGPEFDPKKAREIWDSLETKPKSIDFPFDDSEKNNIIAQRLQAQLKSTLDLQLNLKKMEWKSYLAHLTNQKPGFYRFAWLASFPDPTSHLQVFGSNNPNNNSAYNNADYDKLIDEISKTTDPKNKAKLVNEAQILLMTKDIVIMPIYHYVQYHLISKNVQGVSASPMGILYFHRAKPKS